eukprot:750021-Hanusia_phi.AAC.3
MKFLPDSAPDSEIRGTVGGRGGAETGEAAVGVRGGRRDGGWGRDGRRGETGGRSDGSDGGRGSQRNKIKEGA